MPLESLADRRSFFVDDGDTAVFGETTTNLVNPDASFQILLEREVTGLFDRSYSDPFDVASWVPVFCVVDEDAVHIKQGQRLMTHGHVYEVKDIQPDGEGFTQLRLYWLGRYTVENAWGYGRPYGALRYGERTGSFDLKNPPLDYPFTVDGVFDKSAPLESLTAAP